MVPYHLVLEVYGGVNAGDTKIDAWNGIWGFGPPFDQAGRRVGTLFHADGRRPTHVQAAPVVVLGRPAVVIISSLGSHVWAASDGWRRPNGNVVALGNVDDQRDCYPSRSVL